MVTKEAMQAIQQMTGKTFQKENYEEGKINWTENDFYDNWDKVKGRMKNLLNHKKQYKDEPLKKFLLAHSKNEIHGKPQLIDQTMKKIPLTRLAIKKIKDPETKEELEIQSVYMFDEKFDKRHDGFQKDAYALDFWIYRIISQDGKEYYIFSQKQLPNQNCKFKGMLIELDDFAEMSRSMKIKSLSNIFILREFEPDVKIISPEELIQLTKEKELTEEDWFNILGAHPNGNINRFPLESELLKSAFNLSGKYQGYTLHLVIMGPPGTRKSMGHQESSAYKFNEEPSILEGGDSRIKALIPSFKERPANIGFIAKAERVANIDEIGKLVEAESNKHQSNNTNILGECNFLLDQKVRLVGSGNDNDIRIQATAKCLFTTNPINNKSTIYAHVGLIDPTTMSRMLWWVQDKAEQEFCLSDKSIVEVSPNTSTSLLDIENTEKLQLLKKCWGKVSRNEFLTIYDSCNNFLCDVNSEEVQKIVRSITSQVEEPMKSSVWKPRANHHVFLLIDGLVKHRCLFKDYDNSFTPKEEDYDIAQRILIRMVNSWNTNLLPKQEVNLG